MSEELRKSSTRALSINLRWHEMCMVVPNTLVFWCSYTKSICPRSYKHLLYISIMGNTGGNVCQFLVRPLALMLIINHVNHKCRICMVSFPTHLSFDSVISLPWNMSRAYIQKTIITMLWHHKKVTGEHDFIYIIVYCNLSPIV